MSLRLMRGLISCYQSFAPGMISLWHFRCLRMGKIDVITYKYVINDNKYRLIHGHFHIWPGYHPETPILARDSVSGQYGSRDDNQANMEMPMY